MDFGLYLIVVSTVDITRHAEVSDLNGKLVSHKTVARGEVAMDEVMLCQVFGSRGDLPADVEKLSQGQHRCRR